jgi:MFS family permease
MGIYQAVYGLGMFLGPVIAGAVIEKFSFSPIMSQPQLVRGYSANFYVSMGIALAGMVLAFILNRRTSGLSDTVEKH